VIVRIPSPLLSYTEQATVVQAHGADLIDLLADLERQYPGIRFRMIDEQGAVRPHMRIFVNGEQVLTLATRLAPNDEVQILQALSGGAPGDGAQRVQPSDA
jgi:molybdopterin synthase sulfur carrier subunit